MTIETRSSALDPFLTMRAQSTLLMDPPSPQLLIDGDDLIVTNALDRTDDPAVLITGSNNVFVNEAGATLTGTGTGSGFDPLDGAIEVSGTGNQIQNQLGGVVTGINGIVGTGLGNAVVNDGEVLAANLLAPTAGDSAALSLGENANIQNTGLVRAEAGRNATAVNMAIGGVMDNSGTVEAVGGSFAFGISISQDGSINNSGDVDVTASLSAFGLTAASSGGTIHNSGSVQVTSTSSSAIGVGTGGATTIWNGGSIEAIAAGGRSATGVEAVGGSLENVGTISANVSQGSLEAQSVGAFLASATGSNAGTITATTIDGVSVGVVSIGGGSVDSITSFANSGDILATGSQAFGFNATDFSELTNTGTITAIGSIDPPSGSGRSAGLELQNDASVVSTGSISALANFEVTGIFALDRANIQNGGLVEATEGIATGIGVGTDGTIVNTGTVLAQAESRANGISAGDSADVQNDGVVEASGRFARGITVGADSAIVNNGIVDISTTLNGNGLSVGGTGSSVQNFGVVRTTLDGESGTAFGMGTSFDAIGTTLWNGGTIETIATGGGRAQGVFVSGGSVENEGTISSVTAASGAAQTIQMLNASGSNAGTIIASSVSGLSLGVAALGDSTFANSGDILATGQQAFGYVATDFNELTNTGTVTAIGSIDPPSESGRSGGLELQNDTSVVNTGSISAMANFEVTGILALDRANIQNGGLVEATDGFAAGTGIGVGADSAIVNTGTVLAQAEFGANGITAGDRANVRNDGFVEASGLGTTGIGVGSNSVTVSSGAVRIQSGDFGSGISAGNSSSVQNDGVVEATGVDVAGIDASSDSIVVNTGTVTTTGSIDPPSGSGRSAGLDLENNVSATNTGSISALANFEVVGVSALDHANIQNRGLVEATGGFSSGTGIGVGFDGTIMNSGTVLAQAEFGANGIFALDRATVQNDGAVEAAGLGATGVLVGSNSVVVSSGTVRIQAGDFGSGISAGNFSSVQNDGLVEATGLDVAGIDVFSDSMIVNTGGIAVSAVNGLSFGVFLGFDSQLANSGDITATGLQAAGVELFDGAGLTNTGSITAIGADAKGFAASGSASVVNDGAILAQSVPAGQPSVGLSFDSSTAAQKTVVNNGTITADIAISDNTASPAPELDTLTVENTGLITGALALGNGVDIVFNTGTINGDVDLGSGNDVFDGRGGVVNGTIDGGAGDDIIHGGAGNEILIGDDGTDIIFGSAGADAIDGGAGLDTLDYSASAAGVQVNLGDATQSTSAPIKAGAGTAFGGDAEGDTFQGIEKVIGSAFDDFVYGSPDGSIVELGDGNDVFDNRAAESGNDLVDLGAGNDIARAGAGDDLVQGGAGSDWLSGEDGNDTLLGQDGNDLLWGGLGDDQIDGGAGNDLLAGGGGNDLFTFGLDGGNDLIVGFEAGAGTDDAVDLTAFDTILSFDDVLAIASQTGGGGYVSTVLTFDMDTTLTFAGVRLADLNESDFIIV